MNDKFIVTWKNHQVGEITNPMSDMGYWDGKWKPYPKEQTDSFVKAISKINFEDFRKDSYVSERVILYCKEGNGNPIYGLVYSIEDNQISLRQLMYQESIDMFFPNQQAQNIISTSKVNADEKVELLHEKVRQLIKNKATENEIISVLTKQDITADYAALIIQNVEEDTSKRKEFWKNLIAGILICIATVLLNYLSYENTLPGGSYLIIWGTFVFGAAMIARAFILFRK